MPVWPFKRRRDSSVAAIKDPDAPRPRKRSLTDPSTRRLPDTWSPRTQDSGSAAPAPDVPRHSEKPGRQHITTRLHRRFSSQPDKPLASADYLENMSMKGSQQAVAPGKENVPHTNVAARNKNGSREDITALPLSPRLQQSPHLRPVELDRSPFIPYNFSSQPRLLSSRAGSQKTLPASTKRSATLRSRKSETRAAATPERSLTQKQKKTLREEEIRAMSAPLPIPKRPGDGPLRRESKKVRNSLLARESNVSLPAAESIRSSMNPIPEQRGWEIGILDSFSPRPAVRLSGTPQYVHPGTTPGTPATAIREKPNKDEQMKQEERMFAEKKELRDKEYLIEKATERRREKRPNSKRSKSRKRQTIGAAVDDLDSSDLRLLLERDTKRREERQKAKQDKLDRKLRRRADSDKRRQKQDEVGITEDERQRNEELRRLRGLITPGMTPPTAIHPALRDPVQDEPETPRTVGLGIENDGQATPTGPRKESDPFLTPQASTEFDRFLQPQPSTEFSSTGFHTPPEGPATITSPSEQALDTPLEEDEYEEDEDFVVNTAKAVRLSQTMTNPISEVESKPQTALTTSREQPIPPTQQPAAPQSAPISRPSSEVQAKRSSGWAAFFRRRTLRKSVDTGASEASFSNASRESMRNQPLPAHLVDTQPRSQPSFERRSSGTPVRAMSKFREDLPETPSSPTESHASDLTAAAIRASHRATQSDVPDETILEDDAETPRPMDATARTDTPVSPRRGKLSTSMASIGSEGSWLASGSVKRKSTPTSLNRATGSLSKRDPNFVASYEELGEDQDAAYVKLSGGVRASQDLSASPVESGGIESRLEAGTSDPLTVHESAKRKPTLNSGPRVQSREGLIQEMANSGGDVSQEPTPHPEDVDFFGHDSPIPQVHSATSVNFGRGHVRQISAGSARVLEIPRRDSTDKKSPISPNAPTNPLRNSGLSGQYQPGFM